MKRSKPEIRIGWRIQIGWVSVEIHADSGLGRAALLRAG